MNNLKFVVLFCLTYSMSFSQSGWNKQNSGTSENLKSIYFVDIKNGFIVGDNGTLLRTTDGGKNWDMQSCGTTNNLSKVLFVDSLNGIVIGSNKTYLQTSDGGVNWGNFSDSLQIGYSSISFYDKYNGVAVGETSRYANSAKIFVTKNGGKTWDLLSTITTSNYQPKYIHYEDLNNITVIGSGIGDTQVYKTNDRGNSWENQMLYGTGEFSDASFIDSINGFILAYHGRTSQYYGTIHKTINGGQNWQQIIDWDLPQCSGVYMINSIIGYVVGNDQAYLGTAKQNAIYKTTNGGNSWIKQINNVTTNKLNDVFFIDQNNGIIVGDNGTILKTNTGGEITGSQWSVQSSSTSNDLRGVAFYDSTSAFAVGLNGAILKSINSGISWQKNNIFTDTDFYDIYFTSNKIGFMLGYRSYPEGKFFTSIDEGVDWKLQSSFPEYKYRMSFINEKNGLIAGSSGVMKTTDGGKNWPFTISNPDYYIKDVTLLNENIGYAVGLKILFTSNGGLSWQVLDNSELKGNILNSIEFFNKDVGFAVGSGGLIIKTSDGFNTWIVQTSGTKVELNDINFTDSDNGIIVGDNGNILTTTNGGSVWKKEIVSTGENLKRIAIKDSVVLCVGDEGTIIRYSNWPLSSIRDTTETNLLNYFILFQNYPNPFNPNTTIEYNILKQSYVTIKIYDLLGREIKTLLNEEKEAGNYEVQFNGSDIASGVYFYRLTAGEFNQTKKLVLMK